MSGGIFLIDENDTLIEMTEQSYDSEDLLQELLEKYPNLLAGDQIDSENPRRWLLVTREMGVPDAEDRLGRFSLDHLFLDQDGIPTLVEVKRSSDTRIRREVVGQMLDYAANAVVYWPIELVKTKFEQTCEKIFKIPSDLLASCLYSDFDEESFWQKVKDNLRAGKVRLVFVADELPAELKRIIEFLNEQMDPAEVIGIEIRQYTGQGLKTLVPRVVGQTQSAIEKKRPSASGRQWNEDSFFAEISSKGLPERVDVARNILDWAKKKATGIWWGKGKVTGSFVPMYDAPDGTHYQLFAVFTNGTIQIYFQSYMIREIFKPEAKRLELLNKLNDIEGVSIPKEAITRYPSIALEKLSNKSILNKFCEIYEWFIEEAKQGGEVAH